MKIQRTVTVARSPEQVFTYLQDFTTTEEWEPGTVRTTLMSGDGDVGTRYLNTSRFLGRETELVYVVQQVDPPRLLHLRGENKTLVSDDTITLERTGTGGTRVTYRAEFTFKGASRLVAPLLAPAFKRLGDKAEHGLRSALNPG